MKTSNRVLSLLLGSSFLSSQEVEAATCPHPQQIDIGGTCTFCPINTRALTASLCGPESCNWITSITQFHGGCQPCATCTQPNPAESNITYPGMKTTCTNIPASSTCDGAGKAITPASPPAVTPSAAVPTGSPCGPTAIYNSSGCVSCLPGQTPDATFSFCVPVGRCNGLINQINTAAGGCACNTCFKPNSSNTTCVADTSTACTTPKPATTPATPAAGSPVLPVLPAGCDLSDGKTFINALTGKCEDCPMC